MQHLPHRLPCQPGATSIPALPHTVLSVSPTARSSPMRGRAGSARAARARSRKVDAGFRKRTCSNKEIDRGADSTKRHHDLEPFMAGWNRSAGGGSVQGLHLGLPKARPGCRGRRRRPYPDTAKPAADGFGPNRPGPPVAAHAQNAQRTTGDSMLLLVCPGKPTGGLPLAGPRFVSPLARSIAMRCAAFLADRLAIGQTEPFPSSHERLWHATTRFH